MNHGLAHSHTLDTKLRCHIDSNRDRILDTTELAPGVAPPAGMAKLEEAFKAKDASQMFIGIYEVTIEGELMYQVNADELLEPLDESDIDWTNKDDEVVKAKMKYLYGMGLRMLGSAGPETSEKIKQLVLDKLVSKVGMEGKAFDDWLL